MKKLLTIYSTFRSNNLMRKKEKETLNDIIKGTKSILANKMKFKQYIKNYSKTTEKYTFKTPGITEYPIFRKSSYLLIPVKQKKIKYLEDLNTIYIDKNIDNSSKKEKNKLFFSNKESQYKNKLKYNISTLKTSKHKIKNKIYKLGFIKNRNKKERYNPLFLDFFHKWSNSEKNLNFIENSQSNNFINRDFIEYSNKDFNNIEYIKNKKFSELKYDDNKIFNEDYSKFVNEKINYIKNNTIENKQVKLESNFNDINGKEIKLKLESIKIHFKPIEDKNLLTNSYDNYKNFDEEINKRKENPQKDIVLYIPLYYAFLFYYKNLEYFKHILVSTITFGNDFETITFNDKLIGSSLKAIKLNEVQDSQIKRGITYNSKKDLIPTNINGQFSPKKNLPFRKLATKNYTSFTNTLKNTFSNTLGNNSPKEEDKNCYNLNTVNTFSNMKNELLENILSNKKNKKKEEIIHLNRNKNRNNLYTICSLSEKKQKYEEEEIINNKNNNNYNNYNEYIFLWETSSKTFLVNIKMPMIYFKYKSIKNDIKAFCDKNLFLYIYQNNFINWDFYVLNFLFSIKTFRKIILKNYSLLNKFLLNDLFTKTINNNNLQSLTNNFLIMKNKKKSINNKRYTSFFEIQKKYNIFDEEIIINKNQNKIYNILNENNESYLFFYTDNLYNNSIIKFYSYLITIDYYKLNPKIKWKYYLDFKQMKQLNEISKYESLDSFLPKIIKTDFQNGLLFMDFSLFDEFNIEILGYERKNIIKTNKLKNNTIGLNNTQVNDELCLDIKFPFVKVEKILNNNDSFDNNNNKTNINYIKNKVDLDINFLQRINKYRIDFWSKKILEIINNNYDNSLTLSSNLSPISTHKKLTTRNKKNIKISP